MWRLAYIYKHGQLSKRRYGMYISKIYIDNNIKIIQYIFNNNIHRIKEPAVIYYDLNGNIVDTEYFVHGLYIPKVSYKNLHYEYVPQEFPSLAHWFIK